MTLTEMAGRLGVDPSTLRRALARGTLRGRKLGLQWFVSEEEAARYARESLGQHKGGRKRKEER